MRWEMEKEMEWQEKGCIDYFPGVLWDFLEGPRVPSDGAVEVSQLDNHSNSSVTRRIQKLRGLKFRACKFSRFEISGVDGRWRAI